MYFIIGIGIIIILFAVELQLRKLNQTNERIVELLKEMKDRES